MGNAGLRFLVGSGTIRSLYLRCATVPLAPSPLWLLDLRPSQPTPTHPQLAQRPSVHAPVQSPVPALFPSVPSRFASRPRSLSLGPYIQSSLFSSFLSTFLFAISFFVLFPHSSPIRFSLLSFSIFSSFFLPTLSQTTTPNSTTPVPTSSTIRNR